MEMEPSLKNMNLILILPQRAMVKYPVTAPLSAPPIEAP